MSHEYFGRKIGGASRIKSKMIIPGNAAIRVRLGRVFEKLSRLPQAIEQYKAAQQLVGPAKWLDEANAAVRRLQNGGHSGKN